MKSNKLKIIETINNFINDELVVDSNEFIYISVFVEELKKYCNKNKLFFNESSFKCKICFCLGLKLGIKYKSDFKNSLRIYPQFKFKFQNISNIYDLNLNKSITVNDYNDLKKDIQLLQIHTNHIISNYLEMVMSYRNTISQLEFRVDTLETTILESVKYTEVIKKLKLDNFIINSLNLSQEKDNTYTLSSFCLDFIEYCEDSTSILYSNIIIGDYKNYTNSTINDNILSEILNKSVLEIYPNIILKFDNDKFYYKGLIYKNNTR